jgi:endonuclease YncB( thermonuclease family)
MNVEKKIEKFEKRMGKAQMCETVKVIQFKRKHFKDTLSTSVGFGYQDLKEDAKEFFKYLITNDVDISMTPNSNGDDFGVLVTTVKHDF